MPVQIKDLQTAIWLYYERFVPPPPHLPSCRAQSQSSLLRRVSYGVVCVREREGGGRDWDRERKRERESAARRVSVSVHGAGNPGEYSGEIRFLPRALEPLA